MSDINTTAKRNKLTPRREPYWHMLRRGGYLGYRKLNRVHHSDIGGTWICRWRNKNDVTQRKSDTPKDSRLQKKQEYKTLGDLPEYSEKEKFDHAVKLANQWFDSIKTQVKVTRYTVEMVTDDYLARIRSRKGEKGFKNANSKINAQIRNSVIWSMYLDDLTTKDIDDWHQGMLPDSKDDEVLRKSRITANRYLTSLKAILNTAWHTKESVISKDAWSKVIPFPEVGGARDLFLGDVQLTALKSVIEGDFLNLVTGLLLTGMRPGIEPRHILVEQFDKKNSTLTITESKTGPRIIRLSNDAAKFFKGLAKDKHPKAFLFTNNGEPWKERTTSRRMHQARKDAKLPAKTVLYSLRHAYIAMAVTAGIPLLVIAQNCGTSAIMIEQTYDKFTGKDRHDEFNKVKMP